MSSMSARDSSLSCIVLPFGATWRMPAPTASLRSPSHGHRPDTLCLMLESTAIDSHNQESIPILAGSFPDLLDKTGMMRESEGHSYQWKETPHMDEQGKIVLVRKAATCAADN